MFRGSRDGIGTLWTTELSCRDLNPGNQQFETPTHGQPSNDFGTSLSVTGANATQSYLTGVHRLSSLYNDLTVAVTIAMVACASVSLMHVSQQKWSAVMTRINHVVLAWTAITAILVPVLSADEMFSGDVTVDGALKAREVRTAEGALVSEKRLVAVRQEIVTQAVTEVLNTLRFRSTSTEVCAITDQITSKVMESIEKTLREQSGSNSKSELTTLRRQIVDLENKQKDSERQLSRLERDIEQLRRELAQKQK